MVYPTNGKVSESEKGEKAKEDGKICESFGCTVVVVVFLVI